MKIKLCIGYTGKNNHYSICSSRRIKETFIYSGTDKNFMYNFSLRTEKELNLSQSEKQYFGGDEYTWKTSCIKDYFYQATFILILCRLHFFKRLSESLTGKKDKQGIIKDLLLSNKIEGALARIDDILTASSEKNIKNF